MSAQEWASTPNRSTYLEVDLPEVLLGTAIYRHSRSADQIQIAKTQGFPASSGVRLLSGIAWGLRPGLTDWANAIIAAAPTGGFLLEGLILDIAGFNVPEGDNSVVQHFAYKHPGDLPGVGTADESISQGMPVWRRVVPAGQSWNRRLTADVTAVGQPVLPSQFVEMDRLMVGRQTYPPNQPWVLGFYTPPLTGQVMDTILTFYFGGGSDTDPSPSRNRGYWALSVRGSGEAILFEQEGAVWIQRASFRYSNEPRARGGMTLIEIIPIGKDRLAFRSTAVKSDITQGGRYFAGTTYRKDQTEFLTHLYQHAKAECGHTHLHNITGTGNLRLDFRRDLRFEALVGLQTYPTEGTLYDEPFSIPQVPGGTKLRVVAKKDEPAGTGISIRLFDATTHLELPEDEEGLQTTVAGQRHYYARIQMTSDGKRTPLLSNYTVLVDGFVSFSQPTPITHTGILNVSITGPDLENPNHETAFVEVDDPTNLLPVLRQRSRIAARLYTSCLDFDIDTNMPVESFSVLIQGEIAHAPATKPRRPPLENGVIPQWPSVNYHRFNVSMVGMWARIWDQTMQSREPLVDPETGLGEKVTRLIVGLFYRAGFPPQFLDIPDSDVRVFLSDKDEDNFIAGGKVLAEAILYYASLYTDLFLFWDPNAKKDPLEPMDGLWRGKFYPELPFTILWNFTKSEPGDGKLVHVPESYPENTTFIEDYNEWIQPPECNHLIMVGSADGSDTGRKIEEEYINRRSYQPTQDDPEPDRTHPDYIGHEVRRTFYLPELTTPEAVRLVGRRLWKNISTGLERIDFEAPLVLVRDWDDPYQIRPRPLRPGDMIRIDGRAAMITSCNPAIPKRRGDLHQLAYYEAYYREE